MQILRSFRLVCEPAQFAAVESLLEAEGFRFEPGPFSIYCRRLTHEPFALGASLAAFFGYIYIQDRSSMLPPLALAPKPGTAVLDLAASPGSKSGFLAQLTGRDGLVLANEPNPARLATLRANLQTCNLIQAATCSYPGERLPRGLWSHILLDPPCSGWGTARKNPLAPKIWQGAKIGKLAALQKALLGHAASLLAKEGLLLYSTCTTNPAENEAQTAFAIAELGLEPVPLAPFAGFIFEDAPNGALLVNGDASQSQGFYLSLLRKTGNTQAFEPERATFAQELAPMELASPVCDPALLPPGEVALFGEKARFLPKAALAILSRELKWQGAALGRMNGAKFVPEPRLRILLPGPGSRSIVLEEIEAVRRLLSGLALASDLSDGPAGLWWRQLPLGSCQIRHGRVIARFK